MALIGQIALCDNNFPVGAETELNRQTEKTKPKPDTDNTKARNTRAPKCSIDIIHHKCHAGTELFHFIFKTNKKGPK